MHKAYFLLREDLALPCAKLAVQVGHGVDLLWINRSFDEARFNKWLDKNDGDRRKIVLAVKSLEKLINTKLTLAADNIMTFDIIDSGYNLVASETLTGIAIFPLDIEHKTLKRLRVYDSNV
jgi:peptidyl-tRNA hydrolase